MGEVDAIIPEKSSDSPATSINGEVNGIYKNIEAMEVDNGDDSQISENLNSNAELTTDSDSVLNKKDLLINKIDCLNRSTNNECSNSAATLIASPPETSVGSQSDVMQIVDEESSQNSTISESSNKDNRNENESIKSVEEIGNVLNSNPIDVIENNSKNDDENTTSSSSHEIEDNNLNNDLRDERLKISKESEEKTVTTDNIASDDKKDIGGQNNSENVIRAEIKPTISVLVEENSNANLETIKESKIDKKEDEEAVIIPSDSESEDQDPIAISKSKSTEIPKHEKLKNDNNESKNIVDDDVVEVLSDKDDCVLIEDENKKENNTPRRSQRARKSTSKSGNCDDNDDDDDDDEIAHVTNSQPPLKKQKTSETNFPLPPGQVGQITIKDARSLMPFPNNGLQSGTAAQSPVGKPNVSVPGMTGVFPVNIRPALSPVSSASKALPTPMTPSTQNTAISMQDTPLLPNLTDDMFVLEAPSFIVPYIYEKPPSEDLKQIVSRLATEVEAIKKEKELEKEKDKTKTETNDKDSLHEENKEDEKLERKRKRKKQKNPDDSWGESDESTDEDASDVETRTKILIKEDKNDITNIVTNTEALKQSILGSGGEGDKKSENYFESPLGKFFIDIGIGLVQEYVQADLLRQQKRKRDKARGGNVSEIRKAIHSLKQNLETSRKRNEAFKFEVKRCEFCNFKSESALAMAHHYETPHMKQYMYKCNFCTFEARPPHDILFHMEAIHNIKGQLEKAPSYHQCPNCPFEDNGKSKLARHLPVCAKKFRPEQNLLPPSDWEAPAKIPRIKPRHGLVGTATAYQAMAAQAAAQKAALASFSQRNISPNNSSNNAFMRNRGRPQVIPGGRLPTPVLSTNNRVRQMSPSGNVMPNVHMTGGQFIQHPQQHPQIQQQQQQLAKKSGNGIPSISITALPRGSNNQPNVIPNPMSMQPQLPTGSNANKSVLPPGLKPGQTHSGGSGKSSYVICEICDGYIKDLEQLRNHMQWMHKVKIHPRMIYNRPPLNCQKCQHRFFTDQGLERHLLGNHGLVTSSMQEAANKGKDAGRCPICGRMYQWKLLNHVSRDHTMTLKPAHLSYKCTVCTATFGMYKQFENHVYTAHSTVAKKAMDNKKNSGNINSNSNMPTSSSNLSGNLNRSNISGSLSSLTGNDSLLKPLKINDEITIIPQPSSKSRTIHEIESHVID